MNDILVWSMESGEHMPDKRQFMNQLYRIAAPGGRVLVVTWCHRELKPGEVALSAAEQKLLGKINDGKDSIALFKSCSLLVTSFAW